MNEKTKRHKILVPCLDLRLWSENVFVWQYLPVFWNFLDVPRNLSSYFYTVEFYYYNNKDETQSYDGHSRISYK